MKKIIPALVLLASTAFSTTPDFNSYIIEVDNYKADSVYVIDGADTIATLKNSFTDDKLPSKQKLNLFIDGETFFCNREYTYNLTQREVTIKEEYSTSSGMVVQESYRIITYNSNGQLETNYFYPSQMEFNTNRFYDSTTFSYDSEGKVTEMILASSDYCDYTYKTDYTWHYNDQDLIDSITTHEVFDGIQTNFISIPTYKDGLISEIAEDTLNSSGDVTGSKKFVYLYNSSSIIPNQTSSLYSKVTSVDSKGVIQFPSAMSHNATLYHISGKQLNSFTIQSGEQISDWEKLSSGCYFLQIEGKDVQNALKIVK